MAFTRDRVRLLVIAVVVFTVVSELNTVLIRFEFWRDLYEAVPSYLLEGPVSLIQVAVCLGAVMVTHRLSWRASWRELALGAPTRRHFLFCLLTVTPMGILFAAGAPLVRQFDVPVTLHLVILSPFAEEVIFRGYLFEQLYRRVRLRFWHAVVLTALAFGAAHLLSRWGQVSLDSLIWIMSYTTLGGGLFAWLLVRWRHSLWVPFLIHALMNLAFNVFDLDANRLGTWLPAAGQLSALITAIALTLWWTPPPGPHTDRSQEPTRP